MAEFIVQDERNACSLQRIFPGQPAKNAQESVLANRSEIMENLLYKMMGGGDGLEELMLICGIIKFGGGGVVRDEIRV